MTANDLSIQHVGRTPRPRAAVPRPTTTARWVSTTTARWVFSIYGARVFGPPAGAFDLSSDDEQHESQNPLAARTFQSDSVEARAGGSIR